VSLTLLPAMEDFYLVVGDSEICVE